MFQLFVFIFCFSVFHDDDRIKKTFKYATQLQFYCENLNIHHQSMQVNMGIQLALFNGKIDKCCGVKVIVKISEMKRNE